jgi:hypothetical protein
VKGPHRVCDRVLSFILGRLGGIMLLIPVEVCVRHISMQGVRMLKEELKLFNPTEWLENLCCEELTKLTSWIIGGYHRVMLSGHAKIL